MSALGCLQAFLIMAAIYAAVWPLGGFIARVLDGETTWLTRWLGPVERSLYRLAGIDPRAAMPWRQYANAMLAFNLLGLLAVYVCQRLQLILPLNPQALSAVSADSAFNTAASFASNTNWQGYGGETTMSYLTQMLVLTVQNFVSAATGIAVLAALIRGLRQREEPGLGNFWADLVRTTLYILLPLSTVLAIALVSQGVVQTFQPPTTIALLEAIEQPNAAPLTEQVLALGPVASQVAIKQLGTNGGGFYNTNSAHPFENPTPLSNALELIAILLLPAALCHAFGVMVHDTRQGWGLLMAMTVLFVPLWVLITWAEFQPNPHLLSLGGIGGNMEGKELRFGIAPSALWVAATTAASNGSVNAMHDSLMPLGGLGALFLIQLGEVVYGGVGSGLYGMIVFAVITVFIAGLMVGRTPEYLGKKIEAFEIKMASLVILVPCILVLVLTAVAVVTPSAVNARANPGAHGFSEILYAFTSMGNNNGSAFAGLSANTPFYNLLGGFAMLAARYWIAVPTLALAGSLAAKRITPAGPGTLPTHTPLFVGLLAGVVLLVGALTFMPALALGPVVEHLQLTQ